MTAVPPQRDVIHERLARAASLSAGVVIAVGLVVLIGWAFDLEVLKSLSHPGRVAMNPTSALAVLLLGASLWIQRDEDRAGPLIVVARVLAGLVACVAAARLVGYLFHWEVGIDRVLFRARLGENVMSPNSAAALLLLGLALLGLDVRAGRRGFHPAQMLILAAGCIALFSLTGYLYETSWLYSVHGQAPMPLNTSIALAVLCAGILVARPRRHPVLIAASRTLGGTVMRRLIPPAFLVPLLLGWLRLEAQRQNLLDREVALALLVLAYIIVFNLLIWWCAGILHAANLRHNRTELDLRQSEERYRAIMEQSAEGIYLLDLASKRILDCNAAMNRLFGFSPGQAKSKTIYDLVNDTRQNIDQRLEEVSQARVPLHGERKYQRVDGSIVEVETSAGMITYGGRRVACTIVRDIGGRKEAERLLRASEARGRRILETANDAFVSMDSAGVIVDWNPQAESIFGWTRAQAIGRVLAQTIIPERFRAAHEKGLTTFLQTGTGPVLGQRLELAAVHKDGHEFPVEITISRPVREQDKFIFFAFVHDIGARKLAEEQRDRLFTLSLDMVCVAGFDGFFKRVNRAFEKTLGYTADELLNRPWLDFVHPDDRASTVGAGDKLREGGTVMRFDNRYRCKDGTYKWLSWSSVPVMKDALIYAIARDMTDRKQLEHELMESARAERDAHRKLRDAQSQLVQSEKLAGLGQMVAGVAHEINNPLSFVSNNVAVLERDAAALCELLKIYAESDGLIAEHRPQISQRIDELSRRIDLAYTIANLRELTSRSREGLRRIQQIVKDLRDFARLDQGEVHDADLNAGIDSTVNIVIGLAKKKRVTIDRQLGTIPLITCQPAKLNQVVMNLLSNAIDACDGGGIVTVRTSASDQMISLEVTDTGRGIDPAIRPRIFDPFFTTKPPGAGTGLGLSISYGIIREHGGRIEVDSSPGKGSTFVIKLPIKPG